MLFIFILFSVCLQAQKISTVVSEPRKLKAGTGFFEMLYATESESILRFSEKSNPYFESGRISDVNNLIKFDKDLKPVYETNLDEKIKDGTIYTLVTIKNNTWIIYHKWQKKEKMLQVNAQRLNRETGSPDEDVHTLASFAPMEKPEAYNIFISPDNEDVILTAKLSSENKEKTDVQVAVLNSNLTVKKTLTLTVNVPQEAYSISAAAVGNASRKLSVAGTYMKEFGKKKSERFTYLDAVVVTTIDESKKTSETFFKLDNYMLSDPSLNIKWTNDNRWLFATFLGEPVEENSFLKKKDGLLIGSFDLDKASFNYITAEKFNMELLQKSVAGHDLDAGKPQLGEKDNLNDIVNLGAEKGFLLVGEHAGSDLEQKASMSGKFTWERWFYVNHEILIFKIDNKGKQEWMQAVTKYQGESYPSGTSFAKDNTPLMKTFVGFRNNASRFPLYSGYSMRVNGENLEFLFNDNPANQKLTEKTVGYKAISEFKNSELFQVSVNTVTGNITKKRMLANSEEMILMPRWSERHAEYDFIPAIKTKENGTGKVEFQLYRVKY